MGNVIEKIYFVGNGGCYHTMDFIRSMEKVLPTDSFSLVTDITSAANAFGAIEKNDKTLALFSIDGLLFFKNTAFGNVWRNGLKLLLTPIQLLFLRRVIVDHKSYIIHAHTFYYGLLCWLAGFDYFFTPQGFELTERPKSSIIYAFLMSKVISKAAYVFVDSEKMRQSCINLGYSHVGIYQYGVDTTRCLDKINTKERHVLVSNRGMEKNYRIHEILASRNRLDAFIPITFVYPLLSNDYYRMIKGSIDRRDKDIGTLEKQECYELYAQALLVVSIPTSDSSPRSVYEAIFCGAPVATVNSQWVTSLPESMRKRIIIIDPADPNWLFEALKVAESINIKSFDPCQDSLNRFDQFVVAKTIWDAFYKPLLQSNPVEKLTKLNLQSEN